MKIFTLLLLPLLALAQLNSSTTQVEADKIETNQSTAVSILAPLELEQNSTPANPSAGFNRVYPKSDDLFYILDSAGNETKLLSGQADLTSEVTGVLPIANGGTGSATQNFVDLTTNQTIAGEKTFSSAFAVTNTVTITDAATPLSPFVEILSNDTLTTYFDVNSTGASFGVPLSVNEKFSVVSTTDASIPCPKMTEAQRDALTPTDGECVYNTDTNKLNTYDGNVSSWVEAGGGTGGDFSYLDPGDAETGVDGWTIYANTTPSDAPDDFGGTPSGGTTFTQNLTTPLFETADFKFSKDAANRQGEGVYYQFTAYPGSLAQVHRLIGMLDTSHANYDDDDIKIYLVSSNDSFVADFNIIYTADPGLKAGIDLLKSFQFDATDTAYRLCFHIATTETTAFDVYMDELKLREQVVAYGTPSHDPKSFTPTGSWTTNTTYTGNYSRFGKWATIIYEVYLSGAPNTSILSLDMPSGLTVEESDLPVNASATDKFYLCGTGSALPLNRNPVNAYYDTANDIIKVNAMDASVTYSQDAAVDESTPAAFGVNDTVRITCRVPIAGWGSTTQMSEDVGNRDVVVEGAGNGGTSITAEVTPIDFTESRDTTSSWDGSSFTTPTAGEYEFEGAALFTASTSGDIKLFKNGTFAINLGTAASVSKHKFSGKLRLLRGDVVEIRSSFNGTLSNDGRFHYIHIEKSSSNQTIFDTETVAARYTSNSGQAIGATITDVTYEDIDFDTHSAYNISTGEYGVPASGIYSVSAKIHGDAEAYTSSQNISIYITVNGAAIERYANKINVTATQSYPAQIQVSAINLSKGDKVKIQAVSSVATNLLTNSTLNTFSISRIK